MVIHLSHLMPFFIHPIYSQLQTQRCFILILSIHPFLNFPSLIKDLFGQVFFPFFPFPYSAQMLKDPKAHFKFSIITLIFTQSTKFHQLNEELSSHPSLGLSASIHKNPNLPFDEWHPSIYTPLIHITCTIWFPLLSSSFLPPFKPFIYNNYNLQLKPILIPYLV